MYAEIPPRFAPKVETPSDLLANRLDSWRPGYNPANPEEDWLFQQVVVSSLRVDRCQLQEQSLRALTAKRAEHCWTDDRRLAAEELFPRLSRKPSQTARALRRTLQGADALLDRWRALGAILESQGEWTEAHSSLAQDLLGTPPEFRHHPLNAPADIAAREIASLELLKSSSLSSLDHLERSATLQAHELHPSPSLRALHREEAAALRNLKWAQNLLKKAQRAATPERVEPPAPAPAPYAPHPRTPYLPVDDFDAKLYQQFLLATTDEDPDADPDDDPDDDDANPEPLPSSSPTFRPAPAPAPALPLNRRARRRLASLAR